MRNLFLLSLIFLFGCGSDMSSDPYPKPGTIFHPDTDMTTLSDEELLEGYEVASIAVDNDETDLRELNDDKLLLSKRREILSEQTALFLVGKDIKTTLEIGLREHTQVKERAYKEIQRRGLIPWEHRTMDLEFGLSYKIR